MAARHFSASRQSVFPRSPTLGGVPRRRDYLAVYSQGRTDTERSPLVRPRNKLAAGWRGPVRNQFLHRLQAIGNSADGSDLTVEFANRNCNGVRVDIQTDKSYRRDCDQLLSYAALRRWIHLFAA
jgi:hypothetical protein